MDQTTLQQLASREVLFPVGASLVMASLFLRGFARTARRDLARRKQHALDDRKSHEAELNRDLEKPPGWMERNLGTIASTVLVTGLVITVVSFFRK